MPAGRGHRVPEGRRRRALRGSAGLADQVLSSGTNVATTLVAARLLSPDSFGVLVVALGLGVVAIAAQRSLVGETLLSLNSTGSPAQRSRHSGDAVAFAGLLGVAGAFLALVAVLSGPPLLADVGWMGIWLPAVLVQDACRYTFFCDRRPGRALATDAAWAVVQAGAVAAAAAAGVSSAPFLLGAWGLGGLAGAALGMALGQHQILRAHPVRWFRETRHLSMWFGGTTLLGQVHTQIVVFVVGGVLGSAALGGLRAIQTILVLPVQSVLLAVQSLLVPGLARLADSGSFDLLRRSVMRLAAFFTLAAGVFAVAALLLRRQLVHAVLGDGFVDYTGLVPPVACAVLFYAARAPYTAACRALSDGRGVLSVQAAGTAVTVPFVCIGAATTGIDGAAWGITAGSAALVVASVGACRSAIRRHDLARPGPDGTTAPPAAAVQQTGTPLPRKVFR